MFNQYIKDFEEAELVGANLLAKKECNINEENKDNKEECIYLKDNKCSIHKTRPAVCKKFFCNSKNPQFKVMIEMINKVKAK